MPINYYCSIGMVGSNILMNKNQLIEPVIENSADEPATPVQGQMYFDTTTGDKIMYFYNGTAWVPMDGTGSGVSQITIANAGTNATDINTSLVLSASAGAITLQPMQFGGLAKIGMVPDASGTGDSVKFLKGDGTWATPGGAYTAWTINGDTNSGTNTVSDGETVDIEGGKAIVTSTSTRTVTVDFEPSELTTVTAVSDDKVVITDTSASNTPKTALISDIVALSPAGTVKSVEPGPGLVKTGTAVDPIIGVDYTGTGLIKDAATASSAEADDAILIQDDSDGDNVKSVQFTDVPRNILGNPIAAWSNGNKKITSLADGTANSDAANLGQVLSIAAGSGLFEGGYNADTGLTTDLGAGNGAINGASNIATGLGDFYAVTVAGTQLGVALETGDLIFANIKIDAGDDPANSAFTIVQTGQSIATAAATDALAVKGIAGFDSATFSVTANGFVTSDVYAGTTTKGVVPTGGSATTFLRGDGTFATPINTSAVTSVAPSTANGREGISVTPTTGDVKVGLNIVGQANLASADALDADELIIYDSGNTTNKAITLGELHSYNSFAATITSYGDVTHGLGSFDVIVQLYDDTSKETIQACVDRTSVDVVAISGNSFPATDIRVLVSKVS